MNNYEQSKKSRRIAAVVYLIFMAFILGGTVLSQKDKAQQPQIRTQQNDSQS